LRVCELLDLLPVSAGAHALEILAHRDDAARALWLASVHDRLLERRETAAAHHDNDYVVQAVGLGFAPWHRAPA
jgi:hypothetical protein